MATWKRNGNHPSICVQDPVKPRKPVSRWPVAGPSGFWLLASRPASKSSSPVVTIICSCVCSCFYSVANCRDKRSSFYIICRLQLVITGLKIEMSQVHGIVSSCPNFNMTPRKLVYTLRLQVFWKQTGEHQGPVHVVYGSDAQL